MGRDGLVTMKTPSCDFTTNLNVTELSCNMKKWIVFLGRNPLSNNNLITMGTSQQKVKEI